MLTRADDFPIHQTPEPIAFAGDNRNFYDRYFFNGYDRESEVFFALAHGVYPNVGVTDAALAVIHDGVQTNVRASRSLAYERMNLQVGPLSVEVVEPLVRLRIRCDHAESGVRADLTFSARAQALKEPRFTRRVGALMVMDYTRLTQNGCWEGWIEIAGKRIEVTPDRFRGTRDRSWGLRPVGTPDAQANPAASAPQFYWVWSPMNFDDSILLYHDNADASGASWNTHALTMALDGEPRPMTCTGYEVDFLPGTRHARSARMTFDDGDRGQLVAQLTPRYHFYMKGVGYGHPEMRHGSYHGELRVDHDAYVLAEMDPTDFTNLHIQGISDVVLTSDRGEQRGMASLEQLIIGPYAPMGFEGLLDMASG